MSEFLESEASESRSPGSTLGKRKPFSPSGKATSRFFKREEQDRPIPVLLKVKSDLKGTVMVIFDKDAKKAREDIKEIRFEDRKVCHWNMNQMQWANERYDSTISEPVLNCHPADFVEAAVAWLQQSQWVSEVTIKGPAGTDISEEDVRNLTFNLPKEEKRQVLATTDDIMEDLRLVYRVVRLFAKKAGVTKAEIEAAEAEQESDSE